MKVAVKIKMAWQVVRLGAVFYSVFYFSIIFSSDIPGEPLWKFQGNNSLKQYDRVLLIPVVAFKSKIDDVQINQLKDNFSKRVVLSNAARDIIMQSEVKYSHYTHQNDIIRFVNNNPEVIGLARLSELKPGVRLISVNGIYFYENNKNYPLTLIKEPSQKQAIPNGFSSDELNDVFTFAQTGVTALTRGIIKKVNETNDPLYLTKTIAPFLRQFHLTHASNEVSFSDHCEYVPKTMFFCSPISYFPVLDACGFDIIELTGNHNNDYEYPIALSSIDLYKKHNMKYFGGGKNSADAQKILYIDSVSASQKTTEKGNKQIALIGYNQANNFYQYLLPLAKENSPGANPYDAEKMQNDITSARKKAQTVIVDFQFAECDSYKPTGNDDCYQPMIKPDQRSIFQSAIDDGADIVVGTQAHQPQIIERYKNGIIFYGLGNLFFDQIKWEGTRQGMVLVHIFYKGEYKNTIVYPTYFDERLQVYLANGTKKKQLLDIYYQR